VEPAGDAPMPDVDLDRSLVHGIAWTGGIKSAVQVLSWLSTLVVARLLSPTDYGISGMAMVYIGFVQLVNEFGLSAAVVQRRDLTDDQVARLGGLSILLGATMCALSLIAAPAVAGFFGQRAVQAVIVVLSVTFLSSAFQVLPRSLLARELRFRTLAALEGSEALATTLVTLPLAILGARYWSLVIGAVAGRLVSTVLALKWRRHRLRWPFPLGSTKDSVLFGSHVAMANIAWYIFRNADMTVIGRWLGDKALGAYTLGWNLASLPVDRISTMAARATPAIFARVQDDASALRRYVLALTEAISLLTVPAAVGLALVAPDFVTVVLGPAWVPAIQPVRVLALAAIFRSAVPLMNQILVATGQSSRNMRGTIAIAIILPALFVGASRWGTTGVALVWLLGFPVVSFAFYVRHALATCRMSITTYARAFWPAVSASVIMAAAVAAVHWALQGHSPVLRLIVQVAAGASVYVSVMYVGHKPRLLAFQTAIKGLR